MLNNSQIEAIQKILHKSNIVNKAWLFGSYSRNEESKESDIDIMFEKIPGVRFGYLKLMTITIEMEETLGKKIDFLYIPSMIKEVYKNAEKDKKIIYERK
jgi:predicted nucleotidyltransferase